MFFKHKKFISFLLTICTAFSLCSQTLTVFAVDGSNYQSDFEISLNNTNTIDTNPVIDGIFVIENNGNFQIMMTYPSSTNNNESYIHMIVRGYDTHSELIRIRPFEGIPAMGLPAGTYLIEPVAQPNRYLTVQNDYSVVFKTVGSFPTANMLWNITRNSNGTYRITPYLYSNKALIGPMTSTPGYAPMVEDYFQTVYMQWNIKENYSWYSQQETPNAGWEDGIFNNSNEGAIALDDIIFDSGLYENNSLRYAIRREGCHLTSIAMILANMDQYSDYRYDVRSARSGNIFSDPYVLAMSNLNLSDWSTAADGILSGNGNFSNPMLAVYSYIYDVFDITIEKYTQSDGFPTGKRDKAQEITNLLEDYPQGILIRYSGHSAVVVSSTYTASTPDDEIDDCFIVFDPGKSDPADGNYVTIRRSNRSISDIVSLYFITAN